VKEERLKLAEKLGATATIDARSDVVQGIQLI
jgi:Zn-dependent alcohol dehydrogenase